MDIKVEIKEELEVEESSVMIKTEDEFEDISKLDIENMKDLSIVMNQNKNLSSTIVKKDPDDMCESDIDVKKLKEEFSSSEENESLLEIKTEEIMLKSEGEDDNSNTGVDSEGDMEESLFSFQETEKHLCNISDYKAQEQKDNLQTHLKLENDTSLMKKHSCCQRQKKFDCYHCDYRTINKFNLKRHILAKHEKNVIKKYVCDNCDYKTINKSHLKRHILAKHEKNAIKKSDHKTNRNSNFKSPTLAKHNKSTIKKYKCNQCDYRTHRKIDLYSHLVAMHNRNLVHKYRCEHCDYKTYHRNNFNSHILAKHAKNPIKKYSCEYCDYRTHYKVTLKRHVIVKHDKDATYKYSCEYCHYKAHFKYNLKHHMTKHHSSMQKINAL